MKKGLAEETLFKIVLFVIVLTVIVAFFVPAILRSGNSVLDQIKELLGLDTYEQEMQRDLLKDAIKCAYYRCEKGCNDIDDDDFWRVNCKADYCDSRWQDSDSKICGFGAFQYPVEIELEKEITITEEGFLISGEEPSIRAAKEGCQPKVSLGNLPKLWVSEELVKDDDEDFCKEGTCQLDSDYYYISVENIKTRSLGYFQTFLCDFPKYKTLSYDREKTLTFEDVQKNKNYRIVAEGGRGNTDIALKFNRIFEGASVGMGMPPPDEIELSVFCDIYRYESNSLSSVSGKEEASFCDDQITVTFIEVDGADVVLKIEVKDPKCHEILIRSGVTCPILCHGCKKEPEWDYTRLNMCCYSTESCENGFCSGLEPIFKCGEGCSGPDDLRCPEECPCVQISDDQSLCLNRNGNGDEELECGDECDFSDNQCPLECPLCEEFPDGKYRCDAPERSNLFPKIKDTDFDNIKSGDKFTAEIYLIQGPLEEDDEITCSWDIDGSDYGTELFKNDDFDEITEGVYRLEFDSDIIDLTDEGNYEITITIDAEDVEETDKDDNSDSKDFTYVG